MRKYLLTVVAAALTLSTTTSSAQKVAEGAIKEGLVKVDEAAEHAKKGLKAATWIARGDAYVSALQEPTKALFLGLDATSFPLFFGSVVKPEMTTLKGAEVELYKYPYFWAYVQDGKTISWEIKKEIDAAATQKALDSYKKAYELDASSAEKSHAGLDALVNFYKLHGNLAFALDAPKAGAEAYLMAATIQESPVINEVDPSLLYYAGYMYTVDGSTDVASFAKGEEILKKALAAGFEAKEAEDTEMDEKLRGNIYYYLYNCAYGSREANPAKLQDAKAYLVTGVEKYPLNDGIFEGLLQLYTTEEGLGDPSELLVTIDKKLAENKDDMIAWFSRGRIYFALKNYDECVASFKRVTEIEPELFLGQFYLGLFHMLCADDYLTKINGSTYTDQAAYNADIVKMNAMYAEAVAPFEAAYALDSKDESTLTYLKQLSFRLRDEEGMMDKHNKYSELLKQLPLQQ